MNIFKNEGLKKFKEKFISSDNQYSVVTYDISTSVRSLRAIWSPELAQDVSAYHGIDAEAELTRLLSENIAHEIQTRILNDILNLYQVRNLIRNFDDLRIFSIRPMENKWLLIKKYGIEYQFPMEL
jgi:hypothetical protein